MKSNFANPVRSTGATANPAVDERYDLKGLNLIDPDEIMPAGESPYTINSRMYARNDAESRVANRTRKGAGYLSTPIGEALNVVNTAATTGDAPFTTELFLAQPFSPSSTGPLTRLDVNLKKGTGATGHVILEVYTDVSGHPGTMIAQGSILASLITTTYQYLPAYFIDAPTLTSVMQYWFLAYIQDNGSGTYYLDRTATVVQAQSTSDAGMSWTPLGYSVNYKTYLSTAQGVRGFHLRYPSVASGNRIMIAHRDKIFAIPKSTGVPASVDSGLTDATTPVRFAQFNDKTIWVNGVDQARWWDGSTPAANVAGGTPTNSPSNAIIWQNRLFVLNSNNRVDFSDLNNPQSFSSVNFFYVPAPLSPDHVTGWKTFQDHLVIFTHETKHIIIGSDISTFTRKEAVGTKGAVSQEAIDADRNLIYFMADDLQVYAFNGVSDQLLSEKIQPELQGIADPSKVRIQVYRNQVRVYYAKTPNTTNNRMVLFDLETKQWFLDTDHPISGSTDLYLDNNELVEFSALVGQVMYGEIQGSDLGKKIDWQYRTNYKTYGYRRRSGQTVGGATAKKRIKRLRPIIRVTSAPFNMLVGTDFDFADAPDLRNYLVDGGGGKWGAFVWNDGTLWGPGHKQLQNRAGVSGRANHIQLRFQRKGVETPVELYGFALFIKIGRQK